MADQARQDFARTGTESFKIPGQEEKRVVLNIQEDQPRGVILEKDQAEKELAGNALVRWYSKMNLFFVAHSNVKLKEKANFFHLLSVMINSGIPMVKALRSLVVQMDSSPRLQMIIEDLANSIEGGSSLSEAMLDFENIFGEAEIGMVQSGEASGQLSSVLENLGKDVEKAYAIRSKVKSAMMYPMVIFVLLIAVVIAMMVYVVPKLTQLFDSVEGKLPLITRVVVGISDFMVNHGIILALAVAGLVGFFVIFKKTEVGRYALDEFKLKIPIFGKLLQLSYLSRFARSISNLLDSKVSIVKTLEITANSMGNEVYRRRLLLAMEDVKQGIPLAENLTASSLFPPMLVNMIDVGERTAQLDEIAMKVANFYEEEVDTAVAGISKIIEPVILIIIGGTVAAVVAAIMLPIMELSNLAGAL